jgi:hypothetical protein
MKTPFELPDSAFSLQDKGERVGRVYGFVWQQGVSGLFNQGAIHSFTDVPPRPSFGASKLALTGEARFAFIISSQTKL